MLSVFVTLCGAVIAICSTVALFVHMQAQRAEPFIQLECYFLRLKLINFLIFSIFSVNLAFAENYQNFRTKEGVLTAEIYSAKSEATHPSVIMLHGYQCIEACAKDFERYAVALVAKGIDVYILKYYNDSDTIALAKGGLDGEGYSTRFLGWTSAVREVVEKIRTQPRSNDRVALIGFSQGGRLAIASAANNPAVSALVVFYARLPGAAELSSDIRVLPPLLLLHGSADSVVPLRDGNAIFARAQSLDARSEMIVYPGVGHGFDFSADSEAAKDARRHVLAFLTNELLSR